MFRTILMDFMDMKMWVQPLFLAFGGVLSDYVTTTLGLTMGFCESCQQYHPLWALTFFGGSVAVLAVTLPGKRPWNLFPIGLASASYLGAANNILVILGLSAGIAV